VAGFVAWRGNARQDDANAALSGVISRGWANNKAEAPQIYAQVATDFPRTAAAERALLMAAAGLFRDGKFTESEAQFRRYVSEFPRGPFTAQAAFGIAASLDGQGKMDEAAAAYKDVIDHHPSDNTVMPASLALAGIYESKGKFAEARDLYEKVAREGASSFEQAREYYLRERFVRGGVGSLGSEAVMRLEDLIAKHPELAPAPKQMAPLPEQPQPASTNAPQLLKPQGK
jgi:tetratricopeptide (TPR) repeat protein